MVQLASLADMRRDAHWSLKVRAKPNKPKTGLDLPRPAETGNPTKRALNMGCEDKGLALANPEKSHHLQMIGPVCR